MIKVRKLFAWEIAGKIIAKCGDDQEKRETALNKLLHSHEAVRLWLKDYDNNETLGYETNARDFFRHI